MENLIKERLEQYLPQIDKLFEKIKEFDRIAIFRHEKPDDDALGSQMGLVTFIKDNFPNKEVVYIGDDHVTRTGKSFPKMMEVESSWFENEFLGIVLDLSNMDRIANECASKAKYLIKIDHHPLVEHFGDLEIVDPSMSAVGEFLASIFFSKEDEYKISKECAAYLYKAIVGDSGRFLYSSTTAHTFLIAQKLVQTGFDLVELYHEMYDLNKSDLLVRTYILKHYKITSNGVAYYILKDKQLKKFGLVPIQGKDNVNIFAHFDGIKAWMSITEDVKKGNWRISVRSGGKPVDEICTKFGGGGHAQASATKLKTWKEVQIFINEMNELFK